MFECLFWKISCSHHCDDDNPETCTASCVRTSRGANQLNGIDIAFEVENTPPAWIWRSMLTLKLMMMLLKNICVCTIWWRRCQNKHRIERAVGSLHADGRGGRGWRWISWEEEEPLVERIAVVLVFFRVRFVVGGDKLVAQRGLTADNEEDCGGTVIRAKEVKENEEYAWHRC